MKTMHEEYGEPNDEAGKHLCCDKCGYCITCGDCYNYGCKNKTSEKVDNTNNDKEAKQNE